MGGVNGTARSLGPGGGGFVLGAGYSSALALRGAHVRPKDRGPDLSLFRPIIRGEPTLYLGRDNFAGWELRGDRNVLGFQSNSSPLAFHLNDRPEKAGSSSPPWTWNRSIRERSTASGT